MSLEGRTDLHQREKLAMKFYDDGGKAGVGHCSYGYGTLLHKGPCTPAELKTEVIEDMVKRSFEARLMEAERAVERNMNVALNQQQFDALVSLTYHAGARGAQDVYRLVNGGQF